jgi:hypothetical protein
METAGATPPFLFEIPIDKRSEGVAGLFEVVKR